MDENNHDFIMQFRRLNKSADPAKLSGELIDYLKNRPKLQIKLCLRNLSSMTDNEKEQLAKVVTPKARRWKVDIHYTGAIVIETWGDHHSILENYSPDTFVWLLSRSFDLFGLIESNLAIEKQKD